MWEKIVVAIFKGISSEFSWRSRGKQQEITVSVCQFFLCQSTGLLFCQPSLLGKGKGKVFPLQA
jgi:hypothetical protein